MADCCARVQVRGINFPRSTPCARKGVIERDGKWYCRQHDPVEAARRLDASRSVSSRKWEREKVNIRGPAFAFALRQISQLDASTSPEAKLKKVIRLAKAAIEGIDFSALTGEPKRAGD